MLAGLVLTRDRLPQVELAVDEHSNIHTWSRSGHISVCRARYAFALAGRAWSWPRSSAARTAPGWTIKFWYHAHRAYGVVGYALLFVIFAVLFENLLFDRLSKWIFRWRSAASGDLVQQAFVASAAFGRRGRRIELEQRLLQEHHPNGDGPSVPRRPRPHLRKPKDG
jgi:hypothetical protein